MLFECTALFDLETQLNADPDVRHQGSQLFFGLSKRAPDCGCVECRAGLGESCVDL